MATFHLQIVTPDRMLYDGEAEKLIARTVSGDICILPHHIDYAAPITYGEARITDAAGNARSAACSGGMLSVSGNDVRVMATTFEWADEIDLPRAQRAQADAKALLEKMSRDDKEYAIVEAKLKRALVRTKVKG